MEGYTFKLTWTLSECTTLVDLWNAHRRTGGYTSQAKSQLEEGGALLVWPEGNLTRGRVGKQHAARRQYSVIPEQTMHLRHHPVPLTKQDARANALQTDCYMRLVCLGAASLVLLEAE